MLMSNSNEVVSGKINCIPVCFLPKKMDVTGALFISTWGLSESSRYSQDYVALRKWFGAKHLLLAYQRSNDKLPDAERIGQLALEKGAVVVEIEFLPNNFYAFS